MPDKPKRKLGRQNYDWEMIKLDYVTNPQSSLKQISDKYGIRYRTVCDRSKADDWLATKKKYIKNTTAKALEKASAKDANRLARLVAATDKITEQLERALADPDQFYRQFVPETMSEDGTTVSTYVDKVSAKVDTRAMKDMLQSVKMLEDINRSLHNIQKAEQLNKDRREDEKLKLEREKFEYEKSKQNNFADDEANCGIVILPEVIADE